MRINLKGLYSNKLFVDVCVFLSGLALPFAFAPYHLSYLAFPLISVFLFSVLNQSNKRSFWRGWLFGFAQFVVAFSWIFHSVHTFGHSPVILALAMIVLLAAYCALFPALAAYLSQRFFNQNIAVFLLLGFPLMWLVTEWLRGYLFTGFPWLSLGVSQADTSLAAFAPVIGALGIGALMLLIAGLILLVVLQTNKIKQAIAAIVALFIVGQGLSFINWSEPVSDDLKVSLLQLSVTQDKKWKPEVRGPSMRWYLEQTQKLTDSDIVVWPETAIPNFISRVKPYWEKVKQHAQETDSTVLTGVFMRDSETGRYYNSVVSTGGDYYQKKHLVPLGEYMPFRALFEFLREYVHFPMSNIENGPQQQTLIRVKGFEVGTSVCFEDVFDRDIRSTLPEAKLLVNVSNDAWFKRSAEPFQHHQIARLRAMESARYLLRATNTGMSAVIGPKGEELVTSELFERTVISANVKAMTGATPYVLLGNAPLVLLACLILVWQIYRQRFSARKRPVSETD